MAAIEYTAGARAPLKTGHSVGTQYSIDVKLRGFGESFDFSKSTVISLAGNVETILKRSARGYSITLSWPNTQNADMEEFLFSVAAGEIFSIDPHGTVAVPDHPVDVVMMNNVVPIQRMTRVTTKHRKCTITVRPTLLD